MRFELPFTPPSVNKYWKTTVAKNGRMVKFTSPEAKQFRRDGLLLLSSQRKQLGLREPLPHRVWMKVELCFPDRIGRDLDNYMKPLLDLIQAAEILVDDEQIDDLHITRGEIIKDGITRIEIGVLRRVGTQADLIPGGHDDVAGVVE